MNSWTGRRVWPPLSLVRVAAGGLVAVSSIAACSGSESGIAESTGPEATESVSSVSTSSVSEPSTPVLPPGLTPVSGEVLGDPYESSVLAGTDLRARDFTVRYYGPSLIEGDAGVRMWIYTQDRQPEAFEEFSIAPGERFGFEGYVFEVKDSTTGQELALDVWTPAELSGEVPYYEDGVEAVDERPDAEPIELVIGVQETGAGGVVKRQPGGVVVQKAGGPDGGSRFYFDNPGNQIHYVTAGVGDRFDVDGWVFEVVDSVEGDNVTLLIWDLTGQ